MKNFLFQTNQTVVRSSKFGSFDAGRNHLSHTLINLFSLYLQYTHALGEIARVCTRLRECQNIGKVALAQRFLHILLIQVCFVKY